MKQIESFLQFRIAWIEVPAIGTCGHGIEFHYRQRKGNIHVAFLDGYEWFHEGKGTVRVIILSRDSQKWGELRKDYEKIATDIREAVHMVLEKKPLGHMKNKIYALANA